MSPTIVIRRLGYRLAYRILQVLWMLTRPEQEGVKCVITDRDRVLLVRHTYGNRNWDLPGGMVKRGEPPATTARREMQEELGVAPPEWTDLGSVRITVDHRHDTVHVFGAELDSPVLKLDLGELSAAEWFVRGQLPDSVRRMSAQILRHALPPLDGDQP